MRKMAILKSVVHALDYKTTLPRRILNGHFTTLKASLRLPKHSVSSGCTGRPSRPLSSCPCTPSLGPLPPFHFSTICPKRLASRIFRPVSDKCHHYEPGIPLRVSSHSQIRPVYEECANVSKNSMKLRSVQSNAARQDAGGLFLRFLETVRHHASRVQNDFMAMSALTKKYGTNVVVGRAVCMKWARTGEHGRRRRARR